MTWQLKVRNNGARRSSPLLGKGSRNTHCTNGYACNNRGTFGSGVFYAVLPVAIRQGPSGNVVPLGYKYRDLALLVGGGGSHIRDSTS